MNRRTFLFGALSTAAALLVPDKAAKKIFTMPSLVVSEPAFYIANAADVYTITVHGPGLPSYTLQRGDELYIDNWTADSFPNSLRVVKADGTRIVLCQNAVTEIDIWQKWPEGE